MTFEEMQIILAGVVVSQARTDANQARTDANQARTEENQARTDANQARTDANQAITEENQARIEASQVAFRDNMQLMRQDLANTQAIANSNARAIEATANQQAHDREQLTQLKELQANTQRQLVEFIRFVADYGETTNRRLTTLEDRQ